MKCIYHSMELILKWTAFKVVQGPCFFNRANVEGPCFFNSVQPQRKCSPIDDSNSFESSIVTITEFEACGALMHSNIP